MSSNYQVICNRKTDWIRQKENTLLILLLPEKDEHQIFVKFFKFHCSYDLIPTSAKLVVFDTQVILINLKPWMGIGGPVVISCCSCWWRKPSLRLSTMESVRPPCGTPSNRGKWHFCFTSFMSLLSQQQIIVLSIQHRKNYFLQSFTHRKTMVEQMSYLPSFTDNIRKIVFNDLAYYISWIYTE